MPAWLAVSGLVALLAGCASPPMQQRVASGGRVWDPKLGVWSSPRLVADGDPVPRGGGTFLTGRAYTIGGHRYVPAQDATGYSVVGTASWYGDAFHGRRTANGEIFDKRSISAAHPTLPLPSYVRVTNMKNGRSMIVRVNDRGPYHGGRVMDVSQRVAEALDFRGAGTARIKVDYLAKAPLAGSDDDRLMASLRMDGQPAQLDGVPSGRSTMLADVTPDQPAPQPDTPAPASAALPVVQTNSNADDEAPAAPPPRLSVVPVPPSRPFSLGGIDSPLLRKKSGAHDKLAELIEQPSPPMPTLGSPSKGRKPEALSKSHKVASEND